MMPAVESQRRATVLAVTSGKGGVGKTSVAINVTLALARLGYRVGLLDADFGLGNVDVLLGLTPDGHVGHLVTGERTLADIVLPGPLGVEIIPASSGLRSLTALTAEERGRLREALDQVCTRLDFLLIDTASGVSDNVIETLALSEKILLVTSAEPAALVDAYAMAKVLAGSSAAAEVGLVVNAAKDGDEARLVHRQLDMAVSRFLGRTLRYYGFIVEDAAVRDSVLLQRAVVDYLPQSPASRCYRILTSRLAGLAARGVPPAGVLTTRTAREVQPCA